MFKHIKLTTKTSSWKTSINPNMENKEIKEKFLNKFFDVGSYPNEKLEKVEKVEFLYSATFTGKQFEAIGKEKTFKNIKVFGTDEKDASMNLYNNYEHISNLKIIQNLD